MFRRVLIANRGEIAVRIMRTLKSMGIKAIAVYSEADKDCPYLKLADDAVCIGPARASDSYLNEEAILAAAIKTDAEAIHPGFGFLSENARFAARCELQKLTFIGPSPAHIALMGDKAVARRTIEGLGVPILKGSKDVLKDEKYALGLAAEIGYPVLLKARSGGGGKGMRLVHEANQFINEFREASREAESSFKDGALYLEKFVVGARHIEFQVLGDAYGNVVVLGERECSVQRKNQKLIEEAPANNFSAELRGKTVATIIKAMKKIGYLNAGTLEFLLDSTGELYFMEMNTRIQVEHPVTELTTGVDIVEQQIRIAANEPLRLTQEKVLRRGHAIECRINAEDVKDNFRPTPGEITSVSLPTNNIDGPLRIDTHIANGFKVSPFYDSMLAKIIAYGDTREQALSLMKSSLAQIKISGVATTIDLHQRILNLEPFRTGKYDCSLLSTMDLSKD